MTTATPGAARFPGRVEGKIAVVTGAASGIGKAIAEMLAHQGATVILSDVDVVRGEAVAAQIGANARFVAHDVTEEADWESLMRDVLAHEGRLDILVNNAGLGNQASSTNPENTTLEDWRRSLQVNGDGVFLGCKHAIAAMRKAGAGSIVNMSSIAALVPSPPITAYGFAKAGVAQMTKSVANHCARNGYRIRCNSVHPGQIETPMLAGLFAKMSGEMGVEPDQARAQFLTMVPLGEFGTPDDIAYGVLYLASDEARHVTGAQLVIDGGMNVA